MESILSRMDTLDMDKGYEVTKKGMGRELGKLNAGILDHFLKKLHQLLGDFWKGKKLHVPGETSRDNSKHSLPGGKMNQALACTHPKPVPCNTWWPKCR